MRKLTILFLVSTYLVCSLISVEPETPVTMLNDIRSFCTEKQQEQIDMLINFFEMYDTYESLFSQ